MKTEHTAATLPEGATQESLSVTKPTLAAELNLEKPRRVKAAIYKLRINPEDVVIVKSSHLTGEHAQLIHQTMSKFHRHSLLLFLPDSGSVETMPKFEFDRLVAALTKSRAVETSTPKKSLNPFRKKVKASA